MGMENHTSEDSKFQNRSGDKTLKNKAATSNLDDEKLDDRQVTKEEGFKKEGQITTWQPPPYYFELTKRGVYYEPEEPRRVGNPVYIKSLDVNDDGDRIEFDKIEFIKMQEINRDEPENFVIQHGQAHESLAEELCAGPIEVTTREEWGALPRPEGEEPLELPVLYIHMEYYTPVDPCFTKEDCIKAVKEIQRIHIEERGLPDIAHNFLIGGDGNAYEGRGWNVNPERSTELPKYSGKYLEFAYIGDYRVIMQTNLLMKTQFSLMKKGLDLKYINEYYTFIVKYLDLTRDWIGK